MIRIEPFEIYSVVTGTVRLDGGAMFGVVPKAMWSKKADTDELNRILVAMRTLIAVDRSAGRVILVDTGAGTKWDPDQARRFDIRYDADAIGRALSAIGLSLESVTDIVVTHLHFDHNGGLTRFKDRFGEELVLCFPQARHWIHRRHLEHAKSPSLKDRASFIRHDFEPLEEARVLQPVEGDEPEGPFEGLTWFVSSGHTPGQLHPIFGTGEQRLLFVGDVVPTTLHVDLPWVMAYDVEPLKTIEEKQRIFKWCRDEGLLLAFPHDPSVAGVSLNGTPEKPIIAAPLDLSIEKSPS